jgi:hypothetical protein
LLGFSGVFLEACPHNIAGFVTAIALPLAHASPWTTYQSVELGLQMKARSLMASTVRSSDFS